MVCGIGDDSVQALLLLGVGICPRPQPGAGDGEILVAGQHQRSPAVSVVTTHTDKWSGRGTETNCRNFSHILHCQSEDTAEMAVGSWVDQASGLLEGKARNFQFYSLFLPIFGWFSCGPCRGFQMTRTLNCGAQKFGRVGGCCRC